MSNTAPARGALVLAKEAYALVPARPREALLLAQRARATAAAEHDLRAEVVALHALGWAQNILGDTRATATMRAGIRIAERNGDRRGAALLRRLLAVALAFAGETRSARRELEVAIGQLSGRDRVRSEVHRLEIHRRAGSGDPARHREVCAQAAHALRVLHRAGERRWEAHLLYNRGLLFLDRGELHRAGTDLRRAHALYLREGAVDAAADAAGASAEVARLRGDVLVCLRILDEAQATLPPGRLSYNLESHRATALAQARLIPEARAAAESYIALCSHAGFDDEVAMTMLDLAAIAILSLDGETARRVAMQAARSFSARRKPVAAALARAIWLRARLLEASVPGRSSIRSGLAAAAVLETAGWRRDALRTRLLVARAALASGSRITARRQLGLARPLARSGDTADRIEFLHADALLRLAGHDRTGAERSLRRGLALLDDYQAALGALELRVAASGIGIELSRAGLRLAVESGRPERILAWAERLRGNTLRLPPVRAPRDPRLRSLQTELRQTSALLRDAEEKGSLVPGLAAREARIESAIRARTRLVGGGRSARATGPHPRAVAGTLGDRVLVEYVELDGALAALSFARGTLTFHELGRADALKELEWLRFALGRRARSGADRLRRDAASADALAAAVALDELLVRPLRGVLGESALVLVPTGALHALPWAALPSLRGRPLVVAPSLSVWLALERLAGSRRGGTALVAGPRLHHAASEVRAIAALLPDANVLQGSAATATATLAALEGAELAHIACHGHFRSDNPLFSSLELADGPLNVYELQRLRRAPRLVVLSACDLAVSALHPADELLGLAAALLGMGTRTIVASVVPVPDAAAKRIMLSFHRNLLAGRPPAAALARAQLGASAGFVCLGSG